MGKSFQKNGDSITALPDAEWCRCIVRRHGTMPFLRYSGGLPPECSPSEAAPPESPTSAPLVAAAVLEASPARPAPPSEPTTAPPIEPTSDGTSDLTISEYSLRSNPSAKQTKGAQRREVCTLALLCP